MAEQWDWSHALKECVDEVGGQTKKFLRKRLDFDNWKKGKVGGDMDLRDPDDQPLGRLEKNLKDHFQNAYGERGFKNEDEWKKSKDRKNLLRAARMIGDYAYELAHKRYPARAKQGLKGAIYRCDVREAFETTKAQVCPQGGGEQAMGRYCASVQWEGDSDWKGDDNSKME
jgi:hypothetical protein